MSGRDVMKGFPALMTASDALRRLFDALPRSKLEAEESDLTGALNRVLDEDVVCPFDLPKFDRSTVDGYCIRAVDSVGASPTNPAELRVVEKVYAGDRPGEATKLETGDAALILTGAPLPAGADAVVMVEHCTRVGDVVQVRRQVHSMQNVSRRGEDYSKNDIMMAAGSILKPWHIAALASVGMAKVSVRRSLRLGVLSTGSEIVEPGQALKPGQVSNSTKPMLLAFARQEGCQTVDLRTVPDDIHAIKRSLLRGLKSCDVVLTTGGSSVGEKDLVPETISLIGGKFLAHGVRIRPGRPTGVSVIRRRPIFVLSGFPVAAMAGYQALVKPTLRHLMGASEEPVPLVRGELRRRVSNESGNRSYVRVRVLYGPRGLEIDPLMLTGSGLVSTLTKANGMLILDESIEGYDEGEEVEVMLTGSIVSAPSPGGE